ncbi:protein shisa-5-like [Aulostomus maculatus]
MVSTSFSSLVCVLCVILFPIAWADYCTGYWDNLSVYHEVQQCGSIFCCGNCNRKYCCNKQILSFTQEAQGNCVDRPKFEKRSQFAVIAGSILGSIVPLVSCVSLIICCMAPCCLCYKKCRERRRQTVVNTVVHIPQQPHASLGYQPSYPGYLPVPVQPGYGGPLMPSAPPPTYLEATDPAFSPGGFPQGHPMYPLQPINQPYALPAHPDGLAEPPYNPSYTPYPPTK